MPFLGYLLTPKGVKPLPKKIQAIKTMMAPTNIKQLRSFLGLVTFYRDMWPRRAHTLSPLTDLLGTKKFIWENTHQSAFESMKNLAIKEALLVYPNANKPYVIETDASDYQLGGVIKQHDNSKTALLPIAYYSKKLNSAQQNYTTIEKELLSIVVILKEFRQLLLGAKIYIHTDHKNLTHSMTNFTTQRVLRWRLLLEEFNPDFIYLPGPKNVIADALSWVPSSEAGPEIDVEKLESNFYMGQVEDLQVEYLMHEMHTAECWMSEAQERISKIPILSSYDNFLYYPVFDNRLGYCDFETIQKYQEEDERLQKALQTNPCLFAKQIDNCRIICMQPNNDEWKIVLTDELLPRIVKWYHEFLIYTEGGERLYRTLARHFVKDSNKLLSIV